MCEMRTSVRATSIEHARTVEFENPSHYRWRAAATLHCVQKEFRSRYRLLYTNIYSMRCEKLRKGKFPIHTKLLLWKTIVSPRNIRRGCSLIGNTIIARCRIKQEYRFYFERVCIRYGDGEIVFMYPQWGALSKVRSLVQAKVIFYGTLYTITSR